MNQVLSHIFFANALLGLILLVEVLLNFKRPLLLKGMILTIAGCIFFANAVLLYSFHYQFNRLLNEISKILLLVTILNLLYVIYYHILKKSVLIFSAALIIIKGITIVYFSFILKIDNAISLDNSHAQNIIMQIPRIIVAPVYFIFCLNIYKKIRESFHDHNIFYQKIRRWSGSVILSFYLLLLSFIAQLVFPSFELSPFLLLIVSSFCFALLLLFRPAFLNKTNLEISLSDRFNKLLTTSPDAENIDLSKDLFTISFFHKAYFANKNASLEELSTMLGIIPEQLKAFISINYNLSFTDLVNKSRVGLFVELVQSEENTNLTIEALSEKAGFGSRQNFHKAFKKFHGGNPSDLLKAL